MRHPWFRVFIGAVTAAALVASCAAAPPQDAASPLTVGLVTNNPNGLRNVAGFIDGMAELGYIEGANLAYVFAGEPLKGDALRAALDEMVQREVDLIFTAGTPTGVAAYEATLGTEIPVVFGVIADPIHAGVMSDLVAPGGNLTGVKTNPDHGRRLELLLEIAGTIERVLVPYHPADAAAESAVEQIRELAPMLGVELVLVEAHSDADVIPALVGASGGVDAIFLVPDSLVNAHLDAILDLAARLRLPTSGPSTAQVEDGALTAFGFVHHEAGRQAARIADRVLKGADPGVLPVEDTESFLAINLATAESIGLAVPDAVLRRAALVLDTSGIAIAAPGAN
jgi:putative ABC transport system substrate-binding protein